MYAKLAFALVLFSSITLPLSADVDSGPIVGDPVPPMKVFVVTGDLAAKEIDFPAERKEKPTIYVLIDSDKFSRPIARFLKVLDEAAQKENETIAIVAVWLTEDKDKTKDYLPKVNMSLKLQTTSLTYFPGEKTGPNLWGVNLDADVTVVVANKQKTAAKFGYRSINETDVRAVLQAMKKALAS